MKDENLNLLIQAVESMELATEGLEKALKKGDVENFKKYKLEILRFQKQIAKLLG